MPPAGYKASLGLCLLIGTQHSASVGKIQIDCASESLGSCQSDSNTLHGEGTDTLCALAMPVSTIAVPADAGIHT